MWIAVAIGAYFLLALVTVVDKYLLVGPLPNPKLYAFAIGIFGGIAFLLIPFGFLQIPAWPLIVFALLAGFFQIGALVALFSGLKKFEASRIVPAIGGLLPVFTLLFTMSLGKQNLQEIELAAFTLLVGGSVLITWRQKNGFSFQSFMYALGAALLFSLFVVFSKFVYEGIDLFLSALVWISAGAFVGALFLLFSGELRNELWHLLRRRRKKKEGPLPFRVLSLFIENQAVGAVGFVLQNWAVSLAPFSLVAFVNALEGTKYIFVLLLTSVISLRYPQALKEDITQSAIFQKLIAVVLIGLGLLLLAL